LAQSVQIRLTFAGESSASSARVERNAVRIKRAQHEKWCSLVSASSVSKAKDATLIAFVRSEPAHPGAPSRKNYGE
jgi:hypothetical protein